MEGNKILFIAIIACIIIFALARAYKMRNIRCPKCGGHMVLHSLLDPMGGNISKKVTFSFYQGPRKYKEEWACEACNHQVQKRYWGS